MSPRDAADPVERRASDLEATDLRFRFASGVYGGVLLAGVVSILAPGVEFSSLDPVATYLLGLGAGFVGGFALATADWTLPTRLGRTLARRLAVVAPALLFGLLWFVALEGVAGTVALASAILVFATGYVLSQLAGNRYVDAVTPSDSEETWRWDPPGSLRLDIALFVLYVVLGAGNAASGNWQGALLWLALGVIWIGSCLAEGRWEFGPGRDRCEIQFYETGLVKRRPYTKTFVAWNDINHTRLRGDELEDPDAVLEAVDERLSTAESRYQ